jgi:hypothetical protein
MRGLPDLRSPRAPVPEPPRPYEPARTAERIRARFSYHYGWRDKILGAGREALAGKEERQGERELRRKIGELERALGRKTYELELAGKLLRMA